MKSCLKPTDEAGSAIPEGTTKSVEFGRISFREYPIVMGCNPSVGEGVPVTIGWKYFNEYDVAVNAYERASNKLRARTCTASASATTRGPCPKLDGVTRAKILLGQGYSMIDIVKCTMEVLDLQQKRSDSVRNRKWDGFHSFMEVTKRRLKKTGSLGYTSTNLARPKAPASSPPPPNRIRARRGSLPENTSNSDLGSKVLQREGGTRRRPSLDLVPLIPNANWALTA